MKKFSTAVWHGSGKEGKGAITSQSQAINNAPYTWSTRYTESKGTNPEELIAAAHASCFTMKLSFIIGEEGYTPQEIITTATITLDGGTISESHLLVKAKVPGMNKERFLQCAEKSKNECPVSKALNLKITMEALFETPIEA
jgi:osmotically inducible protein OsmC